jgi:hypothetical protein
LVFSGLVSVFSRDQINCALQQYKDAKALRLPISYSTEQVKASIFGIKIPINEIWAFLYSLTGGIRDCSNKGLPLDGWSEQPDRFLKLLKIAVE